MKVVSEFDYRNAKEILEKKFPNILKEIYDTLMIQITKLIWQKLALREGFLLGFNWFTRKGWRKEQPAFSIGDLRYDLLSERVFHVQHVLGHKQLTSTLICINLEKAIFLNTDDEFHVRVAHCLEEACKLLEVGYEYVTDMSEVKLFRRRK